MAEPEPTPSAPTPAPKPPATPTPPVSGPLAALEAKFYEWFVYKAPFQLPVGLTDFIVKFGPWITLVLAIILIPVLLTAISAALVVNSVITAYGLTTAVRPTFMLWIALIVLVVQIVIMFVSIPKLLKQQRSGWLLLFYADLISFVYGIFNSLAYGYLAIGGIIWALISALIGLYIIFQIRRYYTR